MRQEFLQIISLFASMRAVNIRTYTGSIGLIQLTASWKRNYKLYLQESIGLAIFMISACFFGAMLESRQSPWHNAIPNDLLRLIIMGVLMGATALFIFYSTITAPSGSQINPAVTVAFWRLGKMCHWDVLFYILFQLAGGTFAVYTMQVLMGNMLVDAPVNSVVTIPGKPGLIPALIAEVVIAFITMSMVLFTSANDRLKKYTRVIAAILVCCWVIIAGPVSGFGMNPARTLASAIPSGIWIGWWIYIIAPLAGMLLATENYLLIQRIRFSRKGFNKTMKPV